jgi:hypothetical protein
MSTTIRKRVRERMHTLRGSGIREEMVMRQGVKASAMQAHSTACEFFVCRPLYNEQI